MKKEDKKVPDAPKRLWVQANSLIHDSGLMSVENVSYEEYWIGHKNKKPKDLYPWCLENEVEYISLSQSWHEAKEVPEDLHTFIIGVSKDFTHPILINLEHEYGHEIYKIYNTSIKMIWNKNIRKEFRFAFWAYVKDLVPTIEEGGTK